MNGVLDVETVVTPRGEAIHRAIELAGELDCPAVLSVAEPLDYAPDPLAFLAQATAAGAPGLVWANTSSRVALAGAGAAVSIQANGVDRFDVVSAGLRDLRLRLVCAGVAARFPLVGGFAFAPRRATPALWADFPDALLVAPAILLQVEKHQALARVTFEVEPGTTSLELEHRLDQQLESARSWAAAPLLMPGEAGRVAGRSVPERGDWESSVAAAVTYIRRGLFEKIVLAREERLETDSPFSPVDTLVRLREHDPAATLFGIQSGASWFVGATPERLVRLENRRVDVTCLAGSIGMGDAPSEREALARQLLASEKDRREHEIVVESTLEALAEVCDEVYRQRGTPRVVQARSVQHLETPLEAKLAGTGSVIDLVARLHPTPAVGGYPRQSALSFLPELETIERGWYAGPIGWTDLDGDGEFAVAIRSALLSGNSAAAFAGCGIVDGSLPAAEFVETNLKLKPMISALGAT